MLRCFLSSHVCVLCCFPVILKCLCVCVLRRLLSSHVYVCTVLFPCDFQVCVCYVVSCPQNVCVLCCFPVILNCLCVCVLRRLLSSHVYVCTVLFHCDSQVCVCVLRRFLSSKCVCTVLFSCDSQVSVCMCVTSFAVLTCVCVNCVVSL